MRQLAGTLVLFGLISCAAASDVLDDDSSSGGRVTTMAEVTVEGSPEVAVDLDDPASALCDEGAKCTESKTALESTKVSLAAPYLEVRAFDVAKEGGGSTMLAVRTAGGWQKVSDELLSYYENDPGCPSIEREFAIVEIKVEQNALVVVTDSDRDVFNEEDSYDSLVSTRARACRDVEGELTCGEPTVIAATLTPMPHEDQTTKPEPRTFATKYWVDADGEIETEHPFELAALNDAAPGT